MSLDDLRNMSLDDLTQWLAFFQLKEENRQRELRKQHINRQRGMR